ncbi:hypothetical protein A3C91_01620 [Candidatus Azambacteria bacterium RIFCSPHIGHO2_02_FULL_52_12]|nr:MAG: hypothetical protein A3C91_01620 [Candidatus Azambacteria bacterium RIFCSPHIGHO2_02_FULL_52_12]
MVPEETPATYTFDSPPGAGGSLGKAADGLTEAAGSIALNVALFPANGERGSHVKFTTGRWCGSVYKFEEV